MTVANALNINFLQNQIIYASGATTLSGLLSANNGVLITSGIGVPSIENTLPNLVQDNITRLGTIASIGAPLGSQFGGTGVTNLAGSTITLGGALSTIGAFTAAFTFTGNTTVTFPTTGTLATTAGTVASITGTANRITIGGTATNPTIDIAATYVGQASLTTLGTITTGVWNASVIPLLYGGTNAALVASNGGIFYSTSTAGAILAGTATANQILLSGSNAAPSWSTATYPSSTTINQLLYSSSTNTIAGLATANRGVLTTTTTGVPVITALATDGQLIIGSTAGAPAAASLTAGTGITITPGSNSISIAVTGGAAVTSVSGTANRITSTGGTTPVIDISAAYVGQSSITTLGTITSGIWNGTNIDLAHGGLNASLVASNGGIFYSTATAGAVLAGTVTANQILMSGSSSAPAWSTATYPATAGTAGNFIKSNGSNFTSAAFAAPTQQLFKSASGTYTTPTSPAPLYIRVRAVGGGGGGAGSGTTGTTGGNGVATTFGAGISAGGGQAGATTAGGAGGTNTVPSGTSIAGGTGQGADTPAVTNTGFIAGGSGGASAFGGAGGGGPGGVAGYNGATNSGGGGGGGGLVPSTAGQLGAGGGAGGFVDVIISSPVATYAYVVGAGGTAGIAGASGLAGGTGGSGYIEVTEYYQ